MFEFYKRQILDFARRTEDDLERFFDEIANCEDISDAEYSVLYELALGKIKEIKEVYYGRE